MLRKKNFNQKLIRIDESGKNLEKNKNKNDLYQVYTQYVNSEEKRDKTNVEEFSNSDKD